MTTEDNTPALSATERKYIQRAMTDEFPNGGIVRYYEQALALRAGDAVLEAIELRMRTDFPRQARKIFGARGLYAEDLLARAQEAVRARFDLSNNGRGNHVMVGGDERRSDGPWLLRYIAYRGKGQNNGAMLALVQERPGGELRAQVRYDRVRTPGTEPEVQHFMAGDFAAAQQAYIELLARFGLPFAKNNHG